MSEKFTIERDGQLKFFDKFGINDTELANYTDGVYQGTIFEFKLSISNIHTTLSQAVKYLSRRRIRGENIPANILLVSLNNDTAYLFRSGDYLAEIETPYNGAASKNNKGFSARTEAKVIKYDSPKGHQQITGVLLDESYTKIHIDLYDVVGWAERFYAEQPSAGKIKLFEEFRNPRHFKDLIYPWTGDEKDFKYIMDLLNDKQHKKELGAFYTPAPYCLKATELVRKAIAQIPKDHDYIILDRTAGTGNLEEFLTDKKVDDITVAELSRFISDDLKAKYLQSKQNVITTFYSDRNLDELTIGELEKHKSSLSMRDYIFDDELGHVVVNTYELKEWLVLEKRIGDRVKLIIPPHEDVRTDSPLVNGGDALSKEFVTGQMQLGMSEEYKNSINLLLDYVEDEKTNIILYENPPYRDEAAQIKNQKATKSFVYEEFKNAGTNEASHRELANLFIWSGWNYYLTRPNDCFALFSPIKYWKSLGLGEKKFLDGYLFNRHFFHAGQSAISCILWQNLPDSYEELDLSAFDIDTNNSLEEKDWKTNYIEKIKIKKVHKSIQRTYKDDRVFDNDLKAGVVVDLNGYETSKTHNRTPIHNDNIVGHLRVTSYNLDPISYSLTRAITYNGLEKSQGFYLRDDNFIEKLPLFAAKLYPQKNWYERDIYFTTADGGDKYLADKDFLKTCFIFTCLSQRNHCRSFDGSDGRFYKNELCFAPDTLASKKLASYELTETEQNLQAIFAKVLAEAKKTQNYNPKFAYGPYQIDKELNTFQIDERTKRKDYDYKELNTYLEDLRYELARYYENAIQPKLFEYELLK